MKALRARVTGGRFVLDEALTTLPEGTEVDLVVDDGGDELDDAERLLLHASIARSLEQARAGDLIPLEDVLGELRAGR